MQRKTHPGLPDWPSEMKPKHGVGTVSTFRKNMALVFAISAEFFIALSGNMSILLAAITLYFGYISCLKFISCNICRIYWTACGSLLKSNLGCETVFFTKKST
eukprot:TRINITY_DN11931_c1_g1_i2.p1 TRINITY_DN11931_c1_g1~~TRINITY_DN11931_c1_g1_i2.p1  ORF type:complete len:103 (-),score=8.77 TRINITY_DN11931_c1_g1_i2:186-494(-)